MQALGRSRGGLAPQIHLSVDTLGNPLRFILTGDKSVTSLRPAAWPPVMRGNVIADKGYDSGQFRQSIVERSMTPVIPPRSNRKEPHEYDVHLYRERHPVECFINRIKQFRRIFSRFEKLDARYLAFLHFAGALIWLR